MVQRRVGGPKVPIALLDQLQAQIDIIERHLQRNLIQAADLQKGVTAKHQAGPSHRGDAAHQAQMTEIADVIPRFVQILVARDATHAAHLYHVGASDAVPETIEASLQLSEAVLVDIGIPMGPVIASIHERRAAEQATIKAAAPNADIRPLGRRRLRDARRPAE